MTRTLQKIVNTEIRSEVAGEADFSIIRYGQCWEDANVVLEALDIQPGDVCLSIASAGDNTLSLLTRDPAMVMAIDLSPAQMACLEFRIACYRALDHSAYLEMLGVAESDRRQDLYQQIRELLPTETQRFWDARPKSIRRGIANIGKFEGYLRAFRRFALPLIHSAPLVSAVFVPRDRAAREAFYTGNWDNWRWRVVLRMFASRFISGRFGRDKRFFRYAKGNIGEQVLEMARHGLTEIDPATNPYLRWIAFGRFDGVLPHALRPENFAKIRDNLDRLECRVVSIEQFLAETGDQTINRFNLSDVFEYVSMENYHSLLREIARVGRPSARLVYWNTFVPRARPPELSDRLRPLTDIAQKLHRRAKTFFYVALIVEEVI